MIKYLWQVLRHKWFVFLEACKLGIPWLGLIHDLSKFRPSEFLPYARHFYGNYPEWKTMDTWGKSYYFGRTKESVKGDFDVAWLYHQKRNRHHWQYWMLTEDDPNVQWTIQQMAPDSPMILALSNEHHLIVEVEGDDVIHTEAYRRLRDIADKLNAIRCLPMPDRYRREMLADWRGAGRAYGDANTKRWYQQHRHKIVLHVDTRAWIEDQLGLL